MKYRWSNAQRKEGKISHEKFEAAKDHEALMGIPGRKKSWSATMPAYHGTSLCARSPKPDWGTNNE